MKILINETTDVRSYSLLALVYFLLLLLSVVRMDGYLCLRRGYVFLGCLEAVSFSEYLFILFGFYSFSLSTSFCISRVRSWSTPHWLNVAVCIIVIVVFGPKDPYELI